MRDDISNEQEKKSSLKDIAKKAISKKIKAMPLKTKLTIIGSTIGIALNLLIFIALMAPIILFFYNEEGGGSGGSGSFYYDMSYATSSTTESYAWPIGSSEITTNNGTVLAYGEPSTTIISSGYTDYRELGEGAHHAIDIGGAGTHYIIAVDDGKVHTALSGCDNNGYYGNTCNGGWGNYVVIEHANSVYSLYAHMAPDSITVSAGDTVKKGQVIGKMGNSGSSTGQHLHFQIEVGARSNANAVNPLEYINLDNPRPQSSGNNQFITMIHSWESTGPTSGDNYVVYADSGGVLTVGYGVTLIYNSDKFTAKGIDISTLSKGSQLNKKIVDEIEYEIITEKRSSVKSMLNNNGITLEDYQVDALVMRMYNTGNVNGFPSKYKQYGNTQALYDNYMKTPVTDIDGNYQYGLTRRRDAEWKLFNEGIYTMNS